MHTDYGKQITTALNAILAMQQDCIRLFRDLDTYMTGYDSVFGNVVTLNLGSTINRGGYYIAEGLIRLYAKKGHTDNVLGVNICFFDKSLIEPLVVVANTAYLESTAGPQENLKRGWDPWYGFLDWSQERPFNQGITIEKPAKRSTITTITLAALPLYSVSSLQDVTQLIEIVGKP